jgi:hypothetical protein
LAGAALFAGGARLLDDAVPLRGFAAVGGMVSVGAMITFSRIGTA